MAGRISVSNVTSSNLKLVQTVVSSLYYLLSSVRADWPHSLSPGGLASQGGGFGGLFLARHLTASTGYNGHVFWDAGQLTPGFSLCFDAPLHLAETWMYPTLLLFYPELAQSLLQYRSNTLKGAFTKARSYRPPYKGEPFCLLCSACAV